MNLTQTFSALGDPIRFAIVERLLNEGEQTAGDLQSVAVVSAPAISRHLKVLRSAGIIERRVNRQQRIYSVCPDALQSISDWTMSHKEFWAGSLNRLDSALKEERKK